MSGNQGAMHTDRIPSQDSELDAAPAERLLTYEAVTARAEFPVSPERSAGEEAALAAFRVEVRDEAATRQPRKGQMNIAKARVLAAVLADGLTVGGGVAAAATGALPDAAQQTAKDMLSDLGVDVPRPDAADGDHPAGSGNGEDGASNPQEPRHGEEVSQTARTTTETGADKGALISDVASDGRSRAGDDHANGQPTAPPTPPKPDTPVGEASDGASTAGAGNAQQER